jgi:general secretion pathway protein G
MRAKKREAFTLIELMLVVIIISVLAAMVMPRLVGRSREAKEAAAKSDIANLGLALDMYEMDMNEYPAKLSDLWVNPASAGSGSKAWKGPYLKKKDPKDPWGRDYVYELGSGGKDYKLCSQGAEEAKKEDDICNE